MERSDGRKEQTWGESTQQWTMGVWPNVFLSGWRGTDIFREARVGQARFL